jgi:hypothetical protein
VQVIVRTGGHLASADIIRSIRELLDHASTLAVNERCPSCNAWMKYSVGTFYYDGETWDVPFPFCPDCQTGRLQ